MVTPKKFTTQAFHQLVLHYYRNSFEKVGVPRRVIKEENKAEAYTEDEWNKLSAATNIKAKPLRQWRSEYEKFKHAFETLSEFSQVGQHDNLFDFMYNFFRIRKPIENKNKGDNEENDWTYKLEKDMESLNNKNVPDRILLSSFITFACQLDNEELRLLLINFVTLLINRLDNKKTKLKTINIIKLLLETLEEK